MRNEIEEFDRVVADRLSEEVFLTEDAQNNTFFLEDEDPDYSGVTSGTGQIPTALDEYGDMIIPEMPEADDVTDDIMDKYLNVELIMDVGTGSERKGRVLKRAKGSTGEPIGRAHANPLFDTREYVVEFTDGTTENYFANVIAENMYAQIDSEGQQYQLLNEIVDHRADNTAIPVEQGFVRSRNGNEVPKVTTKGWSLLVSWRDGSTDWVKLKDIKDSHPVQVAEYATSNRIADQPAFKWWVPIVLRKRNRIVSKAKSRYWYPKPNPGIGRLLTSLE